MSIGPTTLKSVASKKHPGKDEVTILYKPGQRILVLDPDSYYRLGEPLEDQVLGGYIITEGSKVTWDSVEQKWLDV